MQEAGELDAGMAFHSFDTETGNFAYLRFLGLKVACLATPSRFHGL